MPLQIRIKTLIPKYAKAGKTGSIGAKIGGKTEILQEKNRRFSLIEPPNAILHRFLSRLAGYSYSHNPEMRAFSLTSLLQKVTFSSIFGPH